MPAGLVELALPEERRPRRKITSALSRIRRQCSTASCASG
jgi:hypothetical protein